MRKDSVGRVWESILSSRVLAEISIYITWHLIQDSGLPANNSENAAKIIWPEDCRMVSLWHEKTSLISTHPSGGMEGRMQYQEHLNTLMWIIVPLNVEPSGRGLTVWRLSRPRCARCEAQLSALASTRCTSAMGRGELNGCKLCINQHQSANNLIRGNGDGDCARQD